MKILMVAVCDRPESTNVGQKEAFENLGHQVECFNHRTLLQSRNLYNTYELFQCRMKSFDPDLVLFCKTNELDEKFIKYARQTATAVYWFPDPLATAMGFHASDMASACDKAFATSTPVVEYFTKLGADCEQIIEGYRPDIYCRKSEKKQYDISFVGSATPERQKAINQIEGAGFRVALYGYGWRGHHIEKADLGVECNVYNYSKLVLNLTRGNIFSDRVVKALACGAKVISQYCQDLVELGFDKYVDLFNESNMVEVIRNALATEWTESEIAGQLEWVSQFTWENQMQKMVEKI